MTSFHWCVKEANPPKIMDLTKDERCDWSNRGVMIEKTRNWQTGAELKLPVDILDGAL